jgi:hypothetical protein
MALTFSSAGTKLYLSASKPTGAVNATSIGALTFTEVLGVAELGSVGPESSTITFNPLGDNQTYKSKGNRNNGAIDAKGAYGSDAGQVLLRAAEASPEEYAMKIELANGTEVLAMVIVTSYKTNIGNSGQITMFESKLEINGPVFFVDAE